MQIRREGLSGYSPLHIKKQVFFTGAPTPYLNLPLANLANP